MNKGKTFVLSPYLVWNFQKFSLSGVWEFKIFPGMANFPLVWSFFGEFSAAGCNTTLVGEKQLHYIKHQGKVE